MIDQITVLALNHILLTCGLKPYFINFILNLSLFICSLKAYCINL